MIREDYAARGQALGRVAAVIEELTSRLNHKDGGDLVTNLTRIYEWWGRELHQASVKLEPERLENISRVMGELKESWEQLHQTKANACNPQVLLMA